MPQTQNTLTTPNEKQVGFAPSQRVHLLFLTTIMAAFMLVPTLANAGYQTRIGNWVAEISNGFGGASGAFECAITANYRNGRGYEIVADDSLRWSLRIRSDDWHLRPGTEARALFWVDQTKPIAAVARQHDLQTVTLRIPDGAWLFERFRNANTLHAKIGDEDVNFFITHARRALNWMLGCLDGAAQEALDKGGPVISRKAPFTTSRTPKLDLSDSPWHPFIFRDTRQGTSNVSEEIDREVVERKDTIGRPGGGNSLTYLSEILENAGYYQANVDILDPEGWWAVPTDALFKQGHLQGAIRQLKTGNTDALSILQSKITEIDQERCGSDFSVIDVSERFGSPKTVLTACRTSIRTTERYYTVVEAPNGQAYLLMLRATNGDRRVVQDGLVRLIGAARVADSRENNDASVSRG